MIPEHVLPNSQFEKVWGSTFGIFINLKKAGGPKGNNKNQ
jgi:hypothetical protein